MVAIFATLLGPMRYPGGGNFDAALDFITIQPELPLQEVAGIVKFPLYVEPAARTIVSPHVAALIALCNAAPFPAGTVRIQLDPLVNVGQADVPCVGRVRSTDFCGSVGNVGLCPRSVALAASISTTSSVTGNFRAGPPALPRLPAYVTALPAFKCLPGQFRDRLGVQAKYNPDPEILYTASDSAGMSVHDEHVF